MVKRTPLHPFSFDSLYSTGFRKKEIENEKSCFSFLFPHKNFLYLLVQLKSIIRAPASVTLK
jgi:hypothetical protein